MPEIRSTGEYATFINTFRCRPEDQAEVVQINAGLIEFEPHECAVAHVTDRHPYGHAEANAQR